MQNRAFGSSIFIYRWHVSWGNNVFFDKMKIIFRCHLCFLPSPKFTLTKKILLNHHDTTIVEIKLLFKFWKIIEVYKVILIKFLKGMIFPNRCTCQMVFANTMFCSFHLTLIVRQSCFLDLVLSILSSQKIWFYLLRSLTLRFLHRNNCLWSQRRLPFKFFLLFSEAWKHASPLSFYPHITKRSSLTQVGPVKIL